MSGSIDNLPLVYFYWNINTVNVLYRVGVIWMALVLDRLG